VQVWIASSDLAKVQMIWPESGGGRKWKGALRGQSSPVSRGRIRSNEARGKGQMNGL